jgi:4-oxalocrotonate tautomerase
MPHVIVKKYKGRSEDVKMQLAKEIVKIVTMICECEEKVVSVAFEEYDPAEWPEKVYKPDIIGKADTLAIKPGYNPFESD